MFKRNTRALGGAALCGALLVSGCANQMSQRSEHEERVEPNSDSDVGNQVSHFAVKAAYALKNFIRL